MSEELMNSEYKINSILNRINNDIKIVKSNDGSILKFKEDKLDYVFKTLDNGLPILFIEDSLAVLSEVYMNVKVGHNNNPHDFEGLAHFLEHMLFMGSKKYPNIDLYSRLVTKCHGSANAYTADDTTMYYFTSGSNTVFDILDVFCNFFVEPLLDPKYVNKEISAVDYEHQKNLASHSFRKWTLIDKFISDDVNSRFRTGDRSSLKKEGIVEALKTFYLKFYTVDRMMLIIVHNRIDQKFIDKVSKVFSIISPRKSDMPAELERYPVHINKVDGYEIIRAHRISDGHNMTIRFFLPDTIKNRKIIDTSYYVLSYLLNHRGRKSLYKLLLDLQLIKNVVSTIGSIYTVDTGYDVVVTLTDLGLKNYQIVIMIILGYLNKIKLHAEPIFLKYMKEMQRLNILSIKTMDRSRGSEVANTVIDILNSYGTDIRYIRIFDILEDVDEMKNHFIKTLDHMILDTELRMKIILMSNTFDASKYSDIDVHYKLKYDKIIEKFNPINLQKYFDVEYLMPELNPYIPKTSKIIIPVPSPVFVTEKTRDVNKLDDPNEYIKLDSDVGNYYYLLKTNDFNTYHAYGSFTINFEALSYELDPVDYMILYVYMLLVTEIHKPEVYLSSVAENSVELELLSRSLRITFGSFDSNVLKTIETYLGWFFKDLLVINENEYTRLYESIRDSILNVAKAEPYTRLYNELAEFVNPKGSITHKQLLDVYTMFEPKAMKNNSNPIKFSNLQERALNLMNKGSIRGVMGGSIKLDTAQNIIKLFDSYFVHKKAFKIRRIENIELTASDDSDVAYIEKILTIKNQDLENKNIGIIYAIHLGEFVRSEYDPDTNPFVIREPMAYLAIADMINDRFFNTMRTEKELGYFVRAGITSIDDSGVDNLFLKFEIQTREPDILSIIQKYINTELIKVVSEFKELDLQSYIENEIEHIISDPANMFEKISLAEAIQSNLTYAELDSIGTSVFLNRLRSLDILRELKKLNIKYIMDLIENAIHIKTRYCVMIVP